ncbi:MAG TPA: lipocalin family protein [Polyangiaceae bacterium]|jgi:apolipoprotein D and lipocalin family protein
MRPSRTARIFPSACRLGLLALATLVFTGCSQNDPSVVRNFELDRFQGHWFEIARIARDYDSLCSDTTADYRQTGPSELDMQYRCALPGGTTQEFHATARADDPSVPAKLTMQLGADAGGYWVLDVDQGYDYVLVGQPSRTMLWILSRASTLAPAIYQHALSVATQQGFDTSQLSKTPQSATSP